MRLYRDEAVVLRTQKLGEADRIVTLLTQRHGRVRAVAKGVRRTSSRFGARVEPFTHVDVQLYEGRELDIVTQVETRAAYGEDLVGDYPRYTAGTAILETAERLTAEEREPFLRLFLLLDAVLLRALAAAGYAPAVDDCAGCGAPGPHRAFAPAAGGVLCTACRPPGAASPAPGTVMLLAALLHGDWPTADSSDARARREASGLTAAYLHWHLERGLRSLRLVERV